MDFILLLFEHQPDIGNCQGGSNEQQRIDAVIPNITPKTTFRCNAYPKAEGCVFMEMACKTALLMHKVADQEQILKQMINTIAANDPDLADVLRNTLKELRHETETLDDIREEFRNIANG